LTHRGRITMPRAGLPLRRRCHIYRQQRNRSPYRLICKTHAKVIKALNISELRTMRAIGAETTVKSTDTAAAKPAAMRRRGKRWRGICAAVIAAVPLLLGPSHGRAQNTDEERRRLEIEAKQRQQQKQKLEQQRAKDKADSARQMQQFQQQEQERENWIDRLEQRNRQQVPDIDRPR
jgi:hypothetical protein